MAFEVRRSGYHKAENGVEMIEEPVDIFNQFQSICFLINRVVRFSMEMGW